MSAILAQLHAVRMQIEALILQVEAQTQDVSQRCPHPEGKQVDASVMGQPRQIQCLACGETRPGVLA